MSEKQDHDGPFSQNLRDPGHSFSMASVYLGFKQFNSETHATEYVMDTELTFIVMST